MDQHLVDLIEKARTREMTADELAQQKIAFVYGNAPSDDTNTIETVREALTSPKIRKAN
ncbi:hypothetical protein TH47_05300 [Thalassospira sp. MCCC 1A02803]|nr:hypothetical protein TH47_05300 [Thalassospira sp. MCCC 1A02803]